MRNIIGAIIVATFIFLGMELSAGERHVVVTKRVGITKNSFALWTSKQARDACVGAMKSVILSGKAKTAEDVERDPDVNKFCETIRWAKAYDRAFKRRQRSRIVGF